MRSTTSVILAGTLIFAVLIVARSASAVPKDAKPDPAGELKGTIKSGTALLKEKKFKEFMELLMAPDELEGLKKSGHFDDVINSMNQNPDKLDVVIKVFDGLADKEPKFNEDKTEATFETPKIDGGPPDNEIKFQKIKDRWYGKTERRAQKPAPK